MQTKTYTIYNYEELSPEAQEKARDWYRNGNEYDFMPEAMHEEAEQLLEASSFYDFEDLQVCYSLNCCQGDGAQVIFDGRYKDYYVKVKSDGRYSHKYATSIDIYDDEHEDASEEIYESFKEEYYALCDKLEKYGYDYIDYENDDDNIADTLIANEYTFLENGIRSD